MSCSLIFFYFFFLIFPITGAFLLLCDFTPLLIKKMPGRRVTFGSDELTGLHQGTTLHNLQSFRTAMTGVDHSWSDIHSTGNTLREKHSVSNYGKGKLKVIHQL